MTIIRFFVTRLQTRKAVVKLNLSDIQSKFFF